MLFPTLLALALAAPPAPPAAPAPGAAAVEAHRLGEWPTRPSGKLVTLADQGLTLDDAVQQIAAAGGWNLVASTGTYGDRELRVALRQVPVEEALDAVLEGTPLVATRRGNTVTVSPGRAAAPERPVLAGFERPTGKRFSGDFADAPVARALTEVADAAGLSLVLPSGLRGAVSGHFREAPVEDVLRALLAQAGLTARRDGAILTVARGAGAPSLVIKGGKRGFSFDVQVPDVGAEVERAEREAARAERDAKRPTRGLSRRNADGHGAAHVTRGDKVLGPGEHADQVVAIGGNVRLEEGATADQVVAVLGSVDLGPGAAVANEVVAVGGDIHVSPGARVGAEAVSVGGKIVIDPSGVVEGDQTSVDVPGLAGMLSFLGARPRLGPRTPLLGAAGALLQFIVFFALGLLLLVLFPRRVETLSGALVHAPLKAVLTGIVGTLALPILAILLVATVVGIPLVAVVVLGALAAAIMGYTALALHLGRLVPMHLERGAPILQLAIGTAVLVALGQLPVLGVLAWLAAWLFMFGVVLRTRFGRPPTAPPPVYGTTATPPIPPPPPVTGTDGR
ncbi:MAG TPA: STN domain-containing protein [Anaeromyxobacteraceae bacterium]|nr:STN domain-containing protein [Anaeromyxobacteraceae bacterium]